MWDLADSLTCFESLSFNCHSGYTVLFNSLRIGDILSLKSKPFLDGVNLCLKFYDSNLGDILT